MEQPTDAATTTIPTYDDYQFHEIDNVNIGKLGRIWFGEQFSIDAEQEFKFNFPNIITANPIEVSTHAAIVAFTPTTFKIEANNQVIGTMSFGAMATNGSATSLEQTLTNTTTVSSADINVKATFNNNGVPNSKGYLDYITIKAKSTLKGNGKQYRFQYNDASTLLGVGEYQVSNAANITQVWDITDLYNVTKAVNANQTNFTFKAYLGETRKYLVVDPSDYYSPLKDAKSKVDNQNLKGTVFNNAQGQFQDVDYLIITPQFLYNQAEKLAVFHRSNSNLNVKTITLESIYQEFGSGKQDIAAIRNFVKYVYTNASATEKRVKYVNLFGDTSYDFKDRIPNNTDIVPIFHALNSYTEGESSFASDDFYGGAIIFKIKF
jgi:hypothetical protein